MDSKQIEAIRARDQSPYMKATTWLSQSEEDRRALLSAYDALRSRLSSKERHCADAEAEVWKLRGAINKAIDYLTAIRGGPVCDVAALAVLRDAAMAWLTDSASDDESWGKICDHCGRRYARSLAQCPWIGCPSTADQPTSASGEAK